MLSAKLKWSRCLIAKLSSLIFYFLSRPLRPPVQWAQRRDKLMISVYLTDIHNEKFTLDETKLTFRLVLLGGSGSVIYTYSGVGGDGSNYAFELELYKEVIPQVCCYGNIYVHVFVTGIKA